MALDLTRRCAPYVARSSRVKAMRRPHVRIDDLLRERRVDRLDLLKVDVEGYEAEVLVGARHALARFRPLVCFELNPLAPAHRRAAVDGAWSVLRELGYRPRAGWRWIRMALGPGRS